MKYIIFLLLIGICQAGFIYDPNSIVVTPEKISIEVTLEMTPSQFKALKYYGVTLDDLFNQVFRRIDEYVRMAKEKLIREVDFDVLKEKLEAKQNP